MPSHRIIKGGRGIYRTVPECERRVAELMDTPQHPIKTVSVSNPKAPPVSRAATSISWTKHDEQKFVNLH